MWISVALIVGGIAALSFALYVLSGDIVTEADKIIADRALIARRAQGIGALADLKRDAILAQSYKDAMTKLLVPQDKLFDFPHWLDGLASSRHVSASFSFDGTQSLPQPNFPGFNGFNLSVSGNNMQDVIDFIKDVEFRTPEFLVDISSFDITKNGDNYSVAMRGRIFFVNTTVDGAAPTQ